MSSGVRITRILSSDEKSAMEDEAIAKGWYRNDARMFLPGMAWYLDFWWMPSTWPKPKWMGEPGHVEEPRLKRGDPFLSIHYWRDWADKRPPIEVVCPNGQTWEIDRKSSNGDGWKVEMPAGIADPNITCSPSIVVPGYHGFLRNGEFTADLENRGPTGAPR